MFIAVLSACASPATVALSPTLDPTPTAWPRTRLNSPEYAAQVFVWWKPETARRDLNLLRDMGFTWVKQAFAWRDIEGNAKGHFSWELADEVVRKVGNRKLKLLARIDRQPFWSRPNDPAPLENAPPENLQDFADFCYTLAERYRGRIHAYQVWNEPNLAREWGGQPPEPAAYVELLKVCYTAIKRADPEALVVSAGMAPTGTWSNEVMPDDVFIERMYAAGAAPYFDLLGVHAPGFKAPPEASPDEVAASPELGGQRFFCFRHVEDLRALMVQHGDADKQVAVLEMGWTTDSIHPEYAWHRVDEQTQAAYLVRAFRFAQAHWSPWISLVTVIGFADPFWTEDDEQYWWTIAYPDWPETRVKPAYAALQAMAKE
ncbi:MAG TPA: cellulase family glycosylhydrolase [Anaerolineae bacterium]|nr:cellulase family glycosylhydrolase [Anaerolineae bacterium]